MKLMEMLKRKMKKKPVSAAWNVFNMFEEIEFAECSNCGAEVEPDFTWFPHTIYPEICPNCGAEMLWQDAVS